MELNSAAWAQSLATQKSGTDAAMPECPSRSASLPQQMAPGVEFLLRAAGQLRTAASGSPGATTSTDYVPSDKNTVWPEKWGPERLYGPIKLDEHVSRDAMAGGYSVYPMHTQLPTNEFIAQASLKWPWTANQLSGRSESLTTSASTVNPATGMSSAWPDQWGSGKPQFRLSDQSSHDDAHRAKLNSWQVASGGSECQPGSVAAAWSSYVRDGQDFEQMPMPNLPANGPAQQRAAGPRLSMHSRQRWSGPSAGDISQAMMGPVAEAASVPWRPDMAAGKGSLLPLGPMLGQRKELDSATGLSRHLPAEAVPSSAAKPSLLHLGLAGSALPWQHDSATAAHGGRAAPEATLRTAAAGGSMPWQGIGPPPAVGSLLPGTWNVDGIFEPHWSHVQGRKAALTSAGSGRNGGLSLPRKHPCDSLFHRQTQRDNYDLMRPGASGGSGLPWPGQEVAQRSMPRLKAGLQRPQPIPQGSFPQMAQSLRRPLQRDGWPSSSAQQPSSFYRLPSKAGTGGVALTPTTAGEQMNAHDTSRRKWAPGATMQVRPPAVQSCSQCARMQPTYMFRRFVFTRLSKSQTISVFSSSVEAATAGSMLCLLRHMAARHLQAHEFMECCCRRRGWMTRGYARPTCFCPAQLPAWLLWQYPLACAQREGLHQWLQSAQRLQPLQQTPCPAERLW